MLRLGMMDMEVSGKVGGEDAEIGPRRPSAGSIEVYSVKSAADWIRLQDYSIDLVRARACVTEPLPRRRRQTSPIFNSQLRANPHPDLDLENHTQ